MNTFAGYNLSYKEASGSFSDVLTIALSLGPQACQLRLYPSSSAAEKWSLPACEKLHRVHNLQSFLRSVVLEVVCTSCPAKHKIF